MTFSRSKGDVGHVEERCVRCFHRHVVGERDFESRFAAHNVGAMHTASEEMTRASGVSDRSGVVLYCVVCCVVIRATCYVRHNRAMM